MPPNLTDDGLEPGEHDHTVAFLIVGKDSQRDPCRGARITSGPLCGVERRLLSAQVGSGGENLIRLSNLLAFYCLLIAERSPGIPLLNQQLRLSAMLSGCPSTPEGSEGRGK